jgi:acetyl-CoA synthetase
MSKPMTNNPILSRFLKQTTFVSEEDYAKNLEFIVPKNFNFAYDVVDAWAEVAPDKIALLWTNDEGAERKLSFDDLKRMSDQAASYLGSLGIERGDMVMLIEKRRLEWWITMLALHKLGAVPIPATHMLTSHDIVYRNNAASVKAIICVGEPYVLGEVQKAMPESPTVEILVSIGPNVPEGFHDWHKEIDKAAPFRRPRFVNTNGDTMILYFTSGTSGEPKMVAHDFLYALGHLTTGVFWHNLTPDSIHLTVADTGWGKAVWGKFYGQWFAGACVFVFDHEKFTAEKILRQMEKYHITSFCAPPTVYRFLVREDFSHYDLSALRYCTTAGEALNAAVYNKFFELTGIRLMEGFGQTETTLTLGTFPWMQPKPGSMGKPNAQYEIALLRPDLTPCEDGEKGEIAVRLNEGHKAIGLFKEYYRDSNITYEACHDGYYFTGDMAWRDKDGYYWFEGRADDVIKSSGYRIGPFEVESALMTHPAVVECAITGVPDDTRGMVVKATVVLGKEWKDKAGKALIEELQAHVKHVTAPYKYPRIIEFVDELPKTISGKIRRVEIREKDKR